MLCSFLWYCSAPSYGIALLLPMVLLCSFLWYRIWTIPHLVCGPFPVPGQSLSLSLSLYIYIWDATCVYVYKLIRPEPVSRSPV